jgi:hypothetical protein
VTIWIIQEQVDYEEFRVHEVALSSPEEVKKYFAEKDWDEHYVKRYVEIIEAKIQ